MGIVYRKSMKNMITFFGDLPCFMAKITTHTHNKGHYTRPHPNIQRMKRNQLCNEHKEPHQNQKKKETLKLKVES